MKQLLLAGTAVLGLVASGLAARGTPIDFTYTGSLVDFTVPATGTYQILAFGAQGGNVTFDFEGSTITGPGGGGAEIGGTFPLTAGEILQIAVGGMGGFGGGGGTFVVGPNNTPLVIAGGGGGAGGAFSNGTTASFGGLTGPDGGPPGFGGMNGNGGPGFGGGGGGGFLSDGGGLD